MELLILVVVAGVLAAILIPVYFAAAEEGNRAQCRDNIREQLIAMHLFADDYHGTGKEMPSNLRSILGDAVAGYWWVTTPSADNAPLSLYPEYIEDLDLFLCPSTRNIIREDATTREGILVDLVTNARNREDPRGGHSYEYFGWYGNAFPGGMTVKTPNSTEGFEATTLLIFDGDNTPGSNNCPDPTNNHRMDGTNVGFADGHVEWVAREDVNRVWSASFNGEWCPDLMVWVEGEGSVSVSLTENGVTEEIFVSGRQGIDVPPGAEVAIVAKSAPGHIFREWSGSFPGDSPALEDLDWSDPRIVYARFDPDRIQVSGIERDGQNIFLTVRESAGRPYTVQRRADLESGEWETVAEEQTEGSWTGAIPEGEDRMFWRIRRP